MSCQSFEETLLVPSFRLSFMCIVPLLYGTVLCVHGARTEILSVGRQPSDAKEEATPTMGTDAERSVHLRPLRRFAFQPIDSTRTQYKHC
jgi:hypothetical protein